MNLAKRLRFLFIAAAAISLLAALAALALSERGHLGQLRSLADRLTRSDKEKLEAVMGERGLDALKPLSSQLEARRDDLIASVQQLADDPALRALYASANPAGLASAANKKSKPEGLNQALARLASPRGPEWVSAELTDKKGKVIASLDPKSLAKDLSSDPLFKSVSSPQVGPGIPLHEYLRKDVPKAKSESYLAVACGIEGKDGNFAGLARVVIPVQPALEGLFGLKAPSALKGLREAAPHAAVILMRGNGDQVFHSGRGPFAENFDKIGQDYKAVMATMQAKPQGYLGLNSYDGKPGLIAWRRVGAWSGGDASQLLTLAAFLPREDFKAAAGGVGVESPAPFYKKPVVLLILALAMGLSLGIGLLLSAKQTQPLSRTAEGASQIDEYGAAPDGLEFREEADAEIARINQAFNALLAKAKTGEHRVQELDAALRRVEDQASKDATTAAQELSELRSRLAGTESEKAAANAKFEASQKARQDAEAQLTNLKSALETSQRSVDLKNSENKNLSSQVHDLMRTLEEQRKVAQQAQESAAHRDDELVRLSAVNTLSSELKATLTVIKNYISTMLGSVGAISDAQQEFLGVVINKSARLERLIADLVELSEIGSGIKPPRMESLAVSALVQEALLNTRPQADHKKIQLEFAESGNVPQVQADKEKLGAILRALLAQAIKVTSRSEKVSLLLSGRDNAAELRISDPGMSLPPDRAAKVFNQFHGVDSQAGPEFIGTGLRFPIMRAVVEAHGGKIWIESQVGRGKTFVISLPKVGTANMPVAGGLKPASGAPGPIGSPAGLPPLAPKPAGPPPGLPSLPGLPGLPGLGSIPAPPPPGAAPALPTLPGMGAVPAPPPKPIGPPPAPGAVPPPPPKVEFKTEAAKGPLKQEDKASFDAIFGPSASSGPSAAPPAPKAELKTGASLGKDDVDGFAAIFGDPKTGAPKASPPPAAPKPMPSPAPAAAGTLAQGEMANFAAIFGDVPAPAKPSGPPPAPNSVPAPPPPAPAKPAAPAPMPPDLASFDAIFGGPAGPGPSKPAPPPSGGLNTMDDLNNMIQGPG